ncbi:hypothetical protein [Methanoculleus chikugoensis]|uniref:hypothetical protein n=1 Tax=Methanoculleus chikugoensis TaxID=118126 RepID=UPI000ADA0B7B|nr:hypothetical protein [Methanoculleus chikugoensis]
MIMGVHPGYHLANASAKEHLFTYGIIVSTLLAFAITAYCLSAGIFVVCSHLFYVPIILASYRCPDRGASRSPVCLPPGTSRRSSRSPPRAAGSRS